MTKTTTRPDRERAHKRPETGKHSGPKRGKPSATGDADRTARGNTAPGRPKTSRPDKSRPDKTQPGKSRPDKSRPDKPRPDSFRPDTVRDDTARPSEAATSPRAPRPLRLIRDAQAAAASLRHSLYPGLFRPLAADARAALEAFPAALDAVMPLAASHRKDLPDAVHELSLLLTSERGGLAHPYWSSPRLTSAYLRYFLPWNLLRLARLLPGLPLPLLPEGATLVDLGSGPLTLPLALWLALPAWRSIPLRIVAVDTAARALDVGRELFRQIAPDSPWRIHTLREPMHKALRMLRERPFMISAGNVLNELAERGGARRANSDEPLADRMAELAADFADLLDPRGALLCVEPGNRLGGTLLTHVRAGGIEAGLVPLSPCTHAGACPLLERPGRGWCHANMDAADAPQWLKSLASAAGLAKISLSLSHVLMRRAVDAGEDGAEKSGPLYAKHAARVLSEAFAVPGCGLARYGCTGEPGREFVLIAAAGDIPQGAVVPVRPVQPPRTDARSGARVVTVGEATP